MENLCFGNGKFVLSGLLRWVRGTGQHSEQSPLRSSTGYLAFCRGSLRSGKRSSRFLLSELHEGVFGIITAKITGSEMNVRM